MTVAECSSVVLERVAECALRARRAVAKACEGLARDLVEIAQLLTSELVTNAFEHGAGSIRVEAHRSAKCLRVSVFDDGTALPQRRQADPWATSGRGLMLVESLATRWGVNRHTPGKCVWFELRTA